MSILHLLHAKAETTEKAFQAQVDKVRSSKKPKLRGECFKHVNLGFLRIVERMLVKDPRRRASSREVLRQTRAWILRNAAVARIRRKPGRREPLAKFDRKTEKIGRSTANTKKKTSKGTFLKQYFSKRIVKYSSSLKRNYSFFDWHVPKLRQTLPERACESRLYRTTRDNNQLVFDTRSSNWFRSMSLSAARIQEHDYTIRTIKLNVASPF